MEEALLSTPINPNNFPAKLWRLVNSPRYRSIRWDGRGEGLLIDQPLFEAELLSPPGAGAGGGGAGGAGGGGGGGVGGAGAEPELFKTTNFTSFIRQLNLYGFRKVVLGGPGAAGPGPAPGGGGPAGDGPLHHFHSPHFRRDQPQLLVHLKRLTSANKAKLAAGLEVPCRPPNRFQRLLITSASASASTSPLQHQEPPPPPSGPRPEPQGPVAVGQFHRSFRRDSLSPYSYVSTSSHNHSTFPLKGLDRTPIPPRTWQNSLGMHPGQVETSPTFSDKGVPFPVLQRFPTEVTYTLQPSATSVHVQQGPETMVSSSQKYNNYTPSAQYSQAYYPTGVMLKLILIRSGDSLSGKEETQPIIKAASNPPMQSSYPVEFLPSNWPCSATDENKKTEVNLEAVFQIVDELHSSPKLEMVKVEPVENQCSISQSNRGQHILANSNNSNPSSISQASQLEPLTPVGSDITSFVVGTEQAITSSLPQSPEYIYTIHPAQPVENTTMQESAINQQAHIKLKEQLSHNPSPSSVVFVQEGLPFSTHQVDASIKCQTSPPENILPSEQMGFLISEMGPASKPSKDMNLSTPARYRERRSNSQQGKSPDLHLLVDVACKQEHFPKEEELRE